MKKQFLISAVIASALSFSFSAAFGDDAKSSCEQGQDLAPIKAVGMYLDGYHTYKSEEGLGGEKQRQVRTAHYCKQVNPDMFQCLIYDSNKPEAKCIGVEYVITDKLFQTLPPSEQKLWHAHDTEVDTGLLILPGVSNEKQKEILGVLHSTHGKTWQVWPDLTQAVPMGEPVLMWNVDPSKISSATKDSVKAREANPTF